MTAEQKQALIDEIVIQALRDDVRQWQQRAEAAEAKLAELEKQEPRYQIQKQTPYGRESLWIDVASREEAENNVIHGFRWRMVYDAPAPVADLAALVPDEMTIDSDTGTVTESGHVQAVKWWNDCRAAILRKIEEAK